MGKGGRGEGGGGGAMNMNGKNWSPTLEKEGRASSSKHPR